MIRTVQKNPEFRYKHIGKFDLEDMDDFECMVEFRCRKSDIEMLGELSCLPEKSYAPKAQSAVALKDYAFV